MEDSRLDRIESKLDDVRDNISEINVTLGKQHVSLADHIKRTAILEQELKPIKKHVEGVNAVLRFLGALLLLSGAIEGIVALLTYLGNR